MTDNMTLQTMPDTTEAALQTLIDHPFLARIDDLVMQVNDGQLVLMDERMDAHRTLSYSPGDGTWTTQSDDLVIDHKTIIIEIVAQLIKNGRELDLKTAQIHNTGMEAVRTGGFRTPYMFEIQGEALRTFRERLNKHSHIPQQPGTTGRERNWYDRPLSSFIAGYLGTSPAVFDDDTPYTLIVGRRSDPSTLTPLGHGETTRDTSTSRQTLIQL